MASDSNEPKDDDRDETRDADAGEGGASKASAAVSEEHEAEGSGADTSKDESDDASVEESEERAKASAGESRDDALEDDASEDDALEDDASEDDASEDEASEDEASEASADESADEASAGEPEDEPAPPAPSEPALPRGSGGGEGREPERRPALLLAEFDSTKDVLHGAERVRDAGYRHWDVHTPFPIHGMDDAMGLGQSHLGWICLLAGITGCAGAFLMMHWMNGIDYPIIVGGKPPESIVSMVPILFECTVLLTGMAAVIGMLGLNKLPRHHHPIFYSERFERCSDDKFFISIESADPKFDLEETRELLESLHPSHVELVEEEI